jgi:hypothetical protein
MEILKQIKAKKKCVKVIESCETKEHYKSAYNYINLYHNKFEDFIGYNELKRMLNNRYE